MSGGTVVVNQPDVQLVDANGDPVAIDNTTDVVAGDLITVPVGGISTSEAPNKLRALQVDSSGRLRAVIISSALPTGAATESTLAAVLADTAGIEAILTAIRDTAGIKKITDALPAGTNEVGSVAQGTKAANADAWPIVQVDSSGNAATITLDAGVYRQEIQGKVSVIGAVPPPSTTGQVITADNPLTVGSHDTAFTIPTGETFSLQSIIAGNEDPTKGATIEVIYDDGAEHLIERIYTNGQTITISYSDVAEARDGTALNGTGTETIIVRRMKYTGTNIAIDAIVSGYTETT